MRYRLRTLLIVLALGPLAIWGAWWKYTESERREQAVKAMLEELSREIDELEIRLDSVTLHKPFLGLEKPRGR